MFYSRFPIMLVGIPKVHRIITTVMRVSHNLSTQYDWISQTNDRIVQEFESCAHVISGAVFSNFFSFSFSRNQVSSTY